MTFCFRMSQFLFFTQQIELELASHRHILSYLNLYGTSICQRGNPLLPFDIYSGSRLYGRFLCSRLQVFTELELDMEGLSKPESEIQKELEAAGE